MWVPCYITASMRGRTEASHSLGSLDRAVDEALPADIVVASSFWDP